MYLCFTVSEIIQMTFLHLFEPIKGKSTENKPFFHIGFNIPNISFSGSTKVSHYMITSKPGWLCWIAMTLACRKIFYKLAIFSLSISCTCSKITPTFLKWVSWPKQENVQKFKVTGVVAFLKTKEWTKEFIFIVYKQCILTNLKRMRNKWT